MNITTIPKVDNDGTIPTGKFPASEITQVITELMNFITGLGGTPNSSVLTQLHDVAVASFQSLNTNLTQIAATSPINNSFLQYITSAWTVQTPAQVAASINAVLAPATNHANYVPQWNGTNSKTLLDGIPINAASGLVQLNASSQYPAYDGSLITNISGTFKNLILGLDVEYTATTVIVKAGLQVVANGILYTFATDTTLTPTAISGGGHALMVIGVNESTGALSTFKLSDITTAGYTFVDQDLTNHFSNQCNLYYLWNNTFGYYRCTTASGTFRIITLFELITGFTDSSAATIATAGTWPNINDTPYEINVTSTTKYCIGMKISESGNTHIPANSKITEVTSTTQLRMNNGAALGPASSISMIVANDIINIVYLDKLKTYIKMQEHRLDQATGTASIVIFTDIILDLNSEISGNASNRLFTAIKPSSKFNYRIESGATNPSIGFGASLQLYKNSAWAQSQRSGGSSAELYVGLNFNEPIRTGDTLQLWKQADANNFNLNNYYRVGGTTLIIEGE